jgi:hypothetical protein
MLQVLSLESFKVLERFFFKYGALGSMDMAFCGIRYPAIIEGLHMRIEIAGVK